MKAMVINAAGIVTAEEKTYVPEMEWTKLIFVVAHLAADLCCDDQLWLSTLQSWLPILLVGTPRLYGAWHHVLTGLMQHGGLADDVLDHRMNSRTVYINPISRFIYWNMNYHVEHHMFPMVPYHALPKLHELIAHDLPAPTTSIWAGLPRDFPGLAAPTEGRGLLSCARTAGERQAIPIQNSIKTNKQRQLNKR